MYQNSVYAADFGVAEIRYRQEHARGTVRRLSRKQRKHERYLVVQPAGDARA